MQFNISTIGAAALEINPTEKFTSFGEALSYSLGSALFGIAVVFGILALLWGILEVFRIVFYTIPNSKANKAKQQTPKEEPVVQTPPVQTQAEMSNDELIAVITAAVSAYRSAQGVTSGFKVVSFKKR